MSMRFMPIIGVLALAACASTSGGEDASSSHQDGEPVPSTSAGTSPTADASAGPLEFSATTVGGDHFGATALAGTDVIVWFWAPWCPTCLVEGRDEVAPALAELPDGVELLGVAGRSDSFDEMAEFLEWTGTDTDVATHVVDSDATIWAGFGVLQQPAFIFINDDGAVLHKDASMTMAEILEQAEALATA